MATGKHRYLNTKFWNDGYVSELDPIEKLLFIYLLTNEHTNISGIYEIPLKLIAIETGIDVEMLKKIFVRFTGRIGYVEGYVVIKNFIKHQETGSENVKKGIVNNLSELNHDVLKNIVDTGFYELPKYYREKLGL